MIPKEIKDQINNSPTAEQWQKIGIKHHHGVCIPLFALRSEKSAGIGEYTDLIPIIDWIKTLGMDVIQLLPLNETGHDPSPYNAISSCALDPIFIALRDLPHLIENPKLEKQLTSFKIFSDHKRVPYREIRAKKMEWLKEYFAFAYPRLKESPRFHTFTEQNLWLHEYGLFRAIKEEYGDKKWNRWPEKLQNPNEKTLLALFAGYAAEIEFYVFLQFLAFEQLIAVKNYATEKGVFLKGDIPILISRDSVDVWYHREMFDVDHTAGAPPDDYSVYGQKWGFPLFNWENLKKHNYEWWRQRLNVASSCYHMYRVDHVIGFFRIWSMLPDESPVEGKFIPKEPARWEPQGKDHLKMLIESSPMLPLAEDLGLVPKFIYKALHDACVCGTRVMRWEKKWWWRRLYVKTEDYHPINITTVSTHDSSTLAQWWAKKPKEAKPFARMKRWRYHSGLSDHQRKQILRDAHHSSTIFHINLLGEYLAFFPELIWENLSDERINVPGTMLPTNWTYRFRPTVEQIISHKALKVTINEIVH